MSILFSQTGKPSKANWLEFKKDVIYISLNHEHLLGDGYGNKLDGLIGIIESLGGDDEMIVVNGVDHMSSNPLIIRTKNFETEGHQVEFGNKALDLLSKCIVVLAKFHFGDDFKILNLDTEFETTWDDVLNEIKAVLALSIDIECLI